MLAGKEDNSKIVEEIKHDILSKIRISYKDAINLMKGITDYNNALIAVKYDAYYINLIADSLIDYNLCMVSDTVKSYIYKDYIHRKFIRLVLNKHLNLLINII